MKLQNNLGTPEPTNPGTAGAMVAMVAMATANSVLGKRPAWDYAAKAAKMGIKPAKNEAKKMAIHITTGGDSITYW